jgi:hypothetical protein
MKKILLVGLFGLGGCLFACAALFVAWPKIETLKVASAPIHTPVSDLMAAQLFQNHMVMVFIQANTTLVNETARRVKASNLSVPAEMSTAPNLTGMTQGIDEFLARTTVPDFVLPYRQRAIVIQDATKDILKRWVTGKILPDQVLTETAPLLDAMAAILTDTERSLVEVYGFDATTVAQVRQSAKDKFQQDFEPAASLAVICDPAYPTLCIAPPPPDQNCSGLPYSNFTVLPPDPHHFDKDKDGIGCEK